LLFAEKWFDCKALLCPDMAFFLGPLSASPPRFKLVGLCRGDKESSGALAGALQRFDFAHTVHVTDWILDPSNSENRYTRAIRRLRRILLRMDPCNRVLGFLWNRLAAARLRRGIQILSLGELVVTDRLHGHILALLLGRPHIVMDNSNNKVSSFYRTWTLGSSITRLCNSGEELAAAARDLLSAKP
jgi:pyruvyl transferase EpsO